MLTSILPGLRDLRTPLATGYMYLALYWLWFGSAIPGRDQADGVIRRIYELQGFLGVSAVITVVTFVAYLVGSVLNIKQVPSFIQAWILKTVPALNTHAKKQFDDVSRELVAERSRQLVTRLREGQVDLDLVFEQSGVPTGVGVTYGEGAPYEEVFRERGSRTQQLFEGRIRNEVPLMAVRLHSTKSAIFDDYDRSRSEAEFRASLVIPSTLIILTLPLALGATWWLAVIMAVFAIIVGLSLSYRSMLKSREAESTVVQVMAIGEVIKSPTEDFVDSLIAQQKESDLRSKGATETAQKLSQL